MNQTDIFFEYPAKVRCENILFSHTWNNVVLLFHLVHRLFDIILGLCILKRVVSHTILLNFYLVDRIVKRNRLPVAITFTKHSEKHL